VGTHPPAASPVFKYICHANFFRSFATARLSEVEAAASLRQHLLNGGRFGPHGYCVVACVDIQCPSSPSALNSAGSCPRGWLRLLDAPTWLAVSGKCVLPGAAGIVVFSAWAGGLQDRPCPRQSYLFWMANVLHFLDLNRACHMST